LAALVGCGAADNAFGQIKRAEPLVIAPEKGDTLIGDNRVEVQFKVGSRSSGAAQLFVAKATIPAGTAVATHLHEIDEEGVFVLEGEITVTLNGKEHNIGVGGMVFIPPGTWMAISNPSAKPATVLGILPRAELEECFRILYQQHGSQTGGQDKATAAHRDSWHALCRMKLPEKQTERK
jgi:quercetin dioxygenase-like cupin family protein